MTCENCMKKEVCKYRDVFISVEDKIENNIEKHDFLKINLSCNYYVNEPYGIKRTLEQLR